MMRKILKPLILLLLIAAIGALSACQQESIGETNIGIVIPLEHKAMQEIVAGLSDTLKETYPTHLRINIKNAQNDLNLQRSILQQMNDNNDVVITIGLATTQMAASMVSQKPIIGLAASLSDVDRKKLKNCHMAIVHDEIAPIKLLTLLQTINPKLKQITLVHSSAEKVYPEIKATIATGKKLGIEITPMMAATLPDLTSVAETLPPNTEAIMVLKDHLIVSGISVLAKAARQQHIPLVTLDQGSVENGAGLALAVHEREIGVQGAKLVIAILKGKSPCDLPITEMNALTVFINKNTLEQQAQNILAIKGAAKQLDYNVESVKNRANNVKS